MQVQLAPYSSIGEFAADVREGLSQAQKQLPSKYFYDALGSSLFEAICLLPEYGLTRAEERIFAQHAAEIIDSVPGNVLVAELGSGTGKKTRALLEALCRKQPEHDGNAKHTTYRPIEISASALEQCARELQDLSCVNFSGIQREYLGGLEEVRAQRERGRPLLLLFLGSTIGNFDRREGAEFLKQIRHSLRPGDALLLATDLVKPADKLVAAYDDPTGVTAAFNLNLLGRINRELGADFDLRNFEHLALFNEKTNSIEMHLRSLADQQVRIEHAGVNVYFRESETIWTETSHKFTLEELASLADQAGFRAKAQWLDRQWCFAENLWKVE